VFIDLFVWIISNFDITQSWYRTMFNHLVVSEKIYLKHLVNIMCQSMFCGVCHLNSV